MASLDELSAWLERDEAGSRPYRAHRLKVMLEIFESSEEYIRFSGGEDAFSAFNELRLAFIHGLYFTTVVLTLSCIEQELAGALFARGSNEALKATLEKLMKQALEIGEIDCAMFDQINKVRGARNAYVHFREPLHADGLAMRSLESQRPAHELKEEEAIDSLRLLAAFISR